MRYACIEAQRSRHAVVTLCRVLLVSKAGFYAWRERAPSARMRANAQLAIAIRAVHRRSRHTYGSPRVHAELVAQGIRCSEKRVAALMQREGVRANPRRRFRVTTDSRHPHAVAPNVLGRHVAVAAITAPDCVWACDITYVPTREGWLYLAVVVVKFAVDSGGGLVRGGSARRTIRLGSAPTLRAIS